MTTGTTKGLNVSRQQWNYADVIGLVTANLSGETFNGDRAVWLRGIYHLTQEYPHFFKGIHFKPREPFTPYCHKVDEVLKMLGRWEYRSDFNPKFRRIEITDDGKDELKQSLEPRLSQYLDDMREMARALQDYVSPRAQDQRDDNESEGSAG